VEGDSYYPGWRAWVDGVRRPVQELDAVRAVRSSAGRHVIEFRYHPASVYWGLGWTMLGFSIVALLCWRE
jgi:acyl transferase domain-containing protein